MQFDVVWRYFAWANQTLAVFTLWTITVYLHLRKKNIYISLIPAMFMTFITSDYFFGAGEMLGLSTVPSAVLAGIVTLAITVAVLMLMNRNGKKGIAQTNS